MLLQLIPVFLLEGCIQTRLRNPERNRPTGRLPTLQIQKMELLTAAQYGSFEVRVCVTAIVTSPQRTESLSERLCQALNRYGTFWSR